MDYSGENVVLKPDTGAESQRGILNTTMIIIARKNTTSLLAFPGL